MAYTNGGFDFESNEDIPNALVHVIHNAIR